MPEQDTYEIYAVKYAHHERTASANFLGGDPHDGPMPLDYFVWVITNADRAIILDTGFDTEQAQRRGRELVRHPAEGLAMIGIDPATVEDVIISHMHYDHAGNLPLFPRARFHLQDSEMAFCTGRHMCHDVIRHSFSVEDVTTMVRRVFEGRVQFHDGASELAPGITLHRVGGHTAGLQVTRVRTRRGWVVLAADATHLYANIEQGRPFPVVFNVGEVMEGFEICGRLASSARHIIPGHDPLVLDRYPAAKSGLEGIVARLDVEPEPAGP